MSVGMNCFNTDMIIFSLLVESRPVIVSSTEETDRGDAECNDTLMTRESDRGILWKGSMERRETSKSLSIQV